MNIQQGDFIRTTWGQVGKVERVNVVNGVPFFSIRNFYRAAWGWVATNTAQLVSIDDVLNHKAAATAEAMTAA